MKKPVTPQKISNISSIIVTVILWILAFVGLWNFTIAGSGEKTDDSILSLNLEIMSGDDGDKAQTASSISKPAPVVEEAEPEPETEIAPVEPVESPKEEVVSPTEPEPTPEPVPEPKPVETPKPVESPKPPVETPKPAESPREPVKLAKSVDDALDDLWSDDFFSVEEDLGDLFAEDPGKKAGAVNENPGDSDLDSSGSGGKSAAVIFGNGGPARPLITPKEPVIYLSKRNSDLLGSSVKVHLSFIITAQGTLREVHFSPDNALPRSVRDEIEAKLVAEWKYQAGVQENTSYEITVRK